MKTFFYHIVLLAILITLFPISLLLSQNKPEYKNRQIINKSLLFPISDNQKSYDVISYDLKFDFNFQDTTFTGIAEIKTKIIVGSLNKIHLDLAAKSIFNTKANTVDSVVLSGKAVSFTHNDTTLMINLDRSYTNNEIVTLKIFYHTKIDNFYLMIMDKYNRKIIFNLSEPFGSRFWFPCKDYPDDKADSVRMTITVPSEYFAVSNGRLEKVSESGGKKTFYWNEKYPIATYLVSVAIYPYIAYKDYYRYSVNDSMEVLNYVMPEDTSLFSKVRGTIVNLIGFYKTLYGEYPFLSEKYGNVQVAFSGGMENQTITSIGLWNEYVIAHELAHSWFGDAVTCKDFHNIWLNEGFATYSTALYYEKQKSKNDFLNEMNNRKYFDNGTIYRDNLNDDMSIFSETLVYSKASWVLHMLRGIVGDDNFFMIMKNYFTAYKYSVADETSFRLECEKVYGKDLSWFFYEWIHQEYYPNYKNTWFQLKNGSNYQVNLTVEQMAPATYVFKMPVEVTFKSGAWDTTIVVMDSLKTQKFNFVFSKNIDSLFWDKNDHILKKLTSTVTAISDKEQINDYSLCQNYPNPFNSSTVILYNIAKAGMVTIKLFDILGRETKTLLKSYQKEGSYRFNLNAEHIASGIYFYTIDINEYRDVKKMVLLR